MMVFAVFGLCTVAVGWGGIKGSSCSGAGYWSWGKPCFVFVLVGMTIKKM
jgi:hypothetical protein